MQITNYDVLLDGGNEGAFQLIDTEHVGNKRFEVFLNLHKEEYEKARVARNQEEMDRIVVKIVDIVCHKCIPNGRFLEKAAIPIEGESEWMEIGEGELARRRLHQALNGDVSNKMPARSSKVFTKQDQKTDAAISKRRRRGSYARLRRSISESMIFYSTLEKVNNEGNGNINDNGGGDNRQNHGNSSKAWVNLSRMPNPTLIALPPAPTLSLQPMDVVVAASRSSLANMGNPGNARFGILVSMHADNFVAAAGNNDKRREILNELKTVVQTHWKGRFLVTVLDDYQLLPTEAVSASISALLLKEGNVAAAAAAAAASISPLPPPLQQQVTTNTQPTPASALPYRSMSKRTLLDHQHSSISDVSSGSHSRLGGDLPSQHEGGLFNNLSSNSMLSISDSLLPHSGNSDHSLTNGLTRLSFNSASTAGGGTTPVIPNSNGGDEATDKMRNAAVELLKAKKKKRDLMNRVMGRKK
jgi:hypothetical protein